MKRFALIVLVATLAGGIVWLVRSQQPERDVTPDGGPEPEPNLGQERVTAPRAESDTRPLPDVLIDPSLLIEKDLRSLTVFSAGEPVKVYRIALGTQAIGDKEREGDSRTPEGEFYICTKNPLSRYHRALGISYPNAEDADRGLEQGIISRREHRQILEALSRFAQPSWHTSLGGEIMIHGGGSESDWTAGCIAVTDTEAEELFDALPLGTPITISE